MASPSLSFLPLRDLTVTNDGEYTVLDNPIVSPVIPRLVEPRESPDTQSEKAPPSGGAVTLGVTEVGDPSPLLFPLPKEEVVSPRHCRFFPHLAAAPPSGGAAAETPK